MNFHIYPSVFLNETRILKIVRSLQSASIFQDCAVVALWKPGLPKRERVEGCIEVIRVAPLWGSGLLSGGLGKIIKALGWYLAVLMALRGRRISCLNCHSLAVLPISILIKWWKSCILIYEPHELETETAGLHGAPQRAARIVERCLIRYADAVCVVNRSIADWYEIKYGIPKIHIVRNIPYQSDCLPSSGGLLRNALGLRGDCRIFLYQGLMAPGRGVDIMIEAFAKLPLDQHLVLMGYGQLVDHIRHVEKRYKNIHYMPAVHPDDLKSYTSDADVGLSLIEDVCLSYHLSLPNKLFEYIASGVPAVSSNFPEMSKFINSYGCGWSIEPSPLEIVNFISRLTAEDIGEKRNAALRTSKMISWKNEEKLLLEMYRELGFLGVIE